MTFDQSIQHSATEFYLLRKRAENQTAFDQAVEWMRSMKFRADLEKGYTRNRDGVAAFWRSYDWAARYTEYPNFVFQDFFRGHLMNKYSRLLRGLDKV